MKNFEISCDSCVDLGAGLLKKNDVWCIVMKYIVAGVEKTEHFDTPAEFEKFYETLRKGALPTTVAVNPAEARTHFEEILSKTKGDIIHLPLSSGMSATCENCKAAADEINQELKDRQIYVIDTLMATTGIAWLVEEAIKLRDEGKTTHEAIARLEELRDGMQAWVIMSDLFHLKRGGRISGAKATIGTLLGIKPIVLVNTKGKLAIEGRAKGNRAAVNYVLGKMAKYGVTDTIYISRTSMDAMYGELKTAIAAKYPSAKIKEGIVGPVVGTHLGLGSVLAFFEAGARLPID
jgi:DegV family protein with EDD domain